MSDNSYSRRWAATTLLVSNLLLAVLLLVKLDTSPSDVLLQVKRFQSHSELRIESLTEQQRKILEELGYRGKWMAGQDRRWKELENKTRDRIYRSEVKRFAEELQDANESLIVPLID